MPEPAQRKEYGPFVMAILSILTGLIAGTGALVFRLLIALVHNLLFLGTFSFSYDANIHSAASPWGPLVVLVPVAGAAGVVYLVKNFAPEAKGHGVPEVMDAIYYKKGVVRPVVAVVKSLASALSIGSGGSVGREGPIAQIGSAFGSTLGQFLRMPPWECITLIAAGAGGGIAATFNTPVGGLLFASEIILHEVSVKTLVPVILATATATYLGQLFFGTHPAFVIPAFETPFFHVENPLVLLSYVGLGIALGVVSTIFIRSIYACEDLFERRFPGSDYLRHMAGMLLVGVAFYLLMLGTGHYFIEGVGYAMVQDILTGTRVGGGILLLLCALKLFATALTLGTGGSGGIFSPSLFVGATFGAAYGILLHHLMPGFEISTPAFAVAGMAGTVGGVTGAALTAIVIILEMTLDYSVIIPITITVALSYGVRRLLCRESMYTMKLVRRGHFVPEGRQSSIHSLKRAKEIMSPLFLTVPADTPPGEFSALVREQPEIRWFLTLREEGIAAVLSREGALEAIMAGGKTEPAAAAPTESYVTVGGETLLFDILTHMRLARAEVAVVMNGNPDSAAVIGVIGKREIGEALQESMELFPG